MHCDITTELNINPSNIVSKFDKLVKKCTGRTFSSTYFCQIIHITDTDGAFIPNDAIVEDKSVIKPFYTETNISRLLMTIFNHGNIYAKGFIRSNAIQISDYTLSQNYINIKRHRNDFTMTFYVM